MFPEEHIGIIENVLNGRRDVTLAGGVAWVQLGFQHGYWCEHIDELLFGR